MAASPPGSEGDVEEGVGGGAVEEAERVAAAGVCGLVGQDRVELFGGQRTDGAVCDVDAEPRINTSTNARRYWVAVIPPTSWHGLGTRPG